MLISPLIPQGTVCHTPFDHTSAIATALHRFLPGTTLLDREAAASDVGEVLTGPLRTDYPKITPRQPPEWRSEEAVKKPLLDFQVDLVLALAQKMGMQGSDLAQAAGVETVGDAGYAFRSSSSARRRPGARPPFRRPEPLAATWRSTWCAITRVHRSWPMTEKVTVSVSTAATSTLTR